MDATSNHSGWHSAPQAKGSKSEKIRLIFRQEYEAFLLYKVSILALGSI